MDASAADPATAAARPQAAFAVAALTALGCLAGSWLATRTAFEATALQPLHPSAGIALAAALVHGRAALAGVAIGMAVAYGWLGTAGGGPGLALALALAALLQAAAGRWLAGRFLERPLTLSTGRAILRFAALVALPAGLIGASLASAALVDDGRVDTLQRVATWFGWWVGDTLGILIGVPIVLTLIGAPQDAWVPRRLTVGLPLLLATLLLLVAARPVAQWEEQRRRIAFETHARQTADAIALTLHQPLHALQALHSAVLANPGLGRDAMRQATAYWLAEAASPLQALGLSERVARADVPSFEAEVRAEGRPQFRVFDREDAGTVALADEVVAIRFIEPDAGNAAALGVNALSIPAAAAAIGRARDTGAPQATAGFELTQSPGGSVGVVVYQALYRGRPDGEASRRASFRGVAFATLRIDRAFETVLAGRSPALRWCLFELDPKAAHPRLAGAPGCEAEPVRAEAHVRPLDVAGRRWELRLEPVAAATPAPWQRSAWLFSTVGLVAASVFGALLLSVTGRARLIEQAVSERTAQLRHEVAERQRTADALRDSEQRLRSIVDHVPIGVIETDADGRIRDANPRMRDMLGRSAEEFAGRSLGDLMHPDERAADDALLRDLVAGEVPMARRQMRLLAAGGRALWAQVGISVLRDAQGRPQRLVGVVEDITEHLLLLQAERDRERAETASRAKSEFLSRMSHELRTPLNAMLGFAQLLALDRRPVLAEHQLGWTTQVQHAGWHLLDMINDTLDLSRIESGSIRIETVSIDVDALLRSTLAMIAPAAEARGVTIAQRVDPAARAVAGDPTRLKQVLTNLLSNAVKYNVDGGRVAVDVRAGDGGRIEIEVADTGIGMTPAQLEELFQPFNRLGREHGAVEGTGLGLVISRRLAEMMGGGLTALSRAGAGSTFVLSLPAPQHDAALPTAVDVDLEIADAPYRQRSVHYIEDNPTNVEVMRGVLAQRPQIRMEVSMLGLDGLAAIRRQRPSLVLLDMHLPDIDGLELLRHLKGDAEVGDIPVIVVSADANAERIEQALTAGATDYLTKPVAVGPFLERVDELLQSLETRYG